MQLRRDLAQMNAQELRDLATALLTQVSGGLSARARCLVVAGQ
jgi:hypothetical protein